MSPVAHRTIVVDKLKEPERPSPDFVNLTSPEDLIQYRWIVIGNIETYDVYFVGFILTPIQESEYGQFFKGVGYAPSGAAYTTDWYLDEAGITPFSFTGRLSSHRIFTLPEDMSPLDQDPLQDELRLYGYLKRLEQLYRLGRTAVAEFVLEIKDFDPNEHDPRLDEQ